MKTAPDHSTPKLKPRIRAHSPHFPVSDQADGHSHAVHNKVMQELALEPVLWSRRRTFISFTYESSFLVKFLRLTTNIFDPRVGRNLKSPGGPELTNKTQLRNNGQHHAKCYRYSHFSCTVLMIQMSSTDMLKQT